jgi:cell division protein FtsQ
MRRVKPRSEFFRRIAPVAALGIGGLALAGAMTAAALAFAPSPQALGPLRDRAVRLIVDMTAAAGLRLEALTVEGRRMTAADDVLAALDIGRGAPILTIDVAEARAALEALPWVKAAQVERRLPDTVHVVIQEREPYALWQQGARYTLVDRDGHPIVTVPEADRSLPLLVGPDAPQHAAALFADLDGVPELAARVKAAVRVGGRRWNVYLDTYEGGIAVRLPEADVPAAWQRLAALERDYRILARDLAFIDLRLPDRLIVRLRTDPDAAPEKTDKAQSGKKKTPAAVVIRTGPGRTT